MARKGILGTKLGMTQVFDENNRVVPVTCERASTRGTVVPTTSRWASRSAEKKRVSMVSKSCMSAPYSAAFLRGAAVFFIFAAAAITASMILS